MVTTRFFAPLGGVLLACASGEYRTPVTRTPSQAELDAVAAAEWPMPERDYAGTKYSPLAQITTANVSTLRPLCTYAVQDSGSFQAMPVAYKGALFVTTARLTLALDAETCALRWKHAWNGRGRDRYPRNRGVAIKDGRVVRGTTDGYLIALDAATGALLWSRRVADPRWGETFTMPPLVYGELVLIGPGIGEHPMAGWVGAFRLTDGAPVWRTSTIDQTTWPSAEAAAVGGAAVWNAMTLDPKAGLVYAATGNPIPSHARDLRAGDNLHANSLLALDLRSGAVRWSRQMTPNDVHDWDLTHAGPLFETTITGANRKVVVITGKDGLLRLFDRQSHQMLYELEVTTRSNTDAPVTLQGTHACPGMWGGVQWNGPAYHPGLAMLFVNAVDWCSSFTRLRQVRREQGFAFVGGVVVQDSAARAAGWLTAVDARTGGVRWRYRSVAPLIAAVAVTGGGLVFTGELTGDFLALDAVTGTVLYRFDTGAPVGAGVAVFETGGKQRVAVMSGRPSKNFPGWRDPGSPTVLVFGLP